MLVFAGTIGIGKSTYSELLAEHLGTKVLREPVEDNPILSKYYKNPDKYAFSLQIYFLNKRFRSIKEALTDDNNVLDRSIYEDVIFTELNVEEGNISKEEFSIYLELVDNILEELDGMPKKRPDILIFLDGSLEKSLKNIKKRGRSFEQVENNPKLLEYYRKLHGKYTKWYEEYNYSPKMRINTEDLDILLEKDRNKVFKMILEKIEELSKLEISSNRRGQL